MIFLVYFVWEVIKDKDMARMSNKNKNTPMKEWEGERVTFARDVDNAKVQDHDEVVVVGADLEALYPNLVDIEIANITYYAILKSKINFKNVDISPLFSNQN